MKTVPTVQNTQINSKIFSNRDWERKRDWREREAEIHIDSQMFLSNSHSRNTSCLRIRKSSCQTQEMCSKDIIVMRDGLCNTGQRTHLGLGCVKKLTRHGCEEID